MESRKKKSDLRQDGHLISALIIDDEMGAIHALQNMLREYCPEVRVVGSAISIKAALVAAETLQPDLVFLDIEMPPVGSGFDFLKGCSAIKFGVIFTTAYAQYAVRAINVIQPWAYLVKPYTIAELTAAVGAAGKKIEQKKQSALQVANQQALILHDYRRGTIVLHAGDIFFCKADGNLTDLFILKNHKLEKITSSRYLGEIESELPETLFCRTHHRFLVNLNHVDRLVRTGRNGVIHFKYPAQEVIVSVSKMEHFVKRLEAFHQIASSNPSL